MKKNFVTIAVLAALLFSACGDTNKKETTDTEKPSTESVEKIEVDIEKSTFTDQDGNKLELTFDNVKGTATLNFNGETIELAEQEVASGMSYKNENYELTGKGNDIELKKDGNVVFTHKEDIVTSSIKNKEGQTLDMTFNNTTNTAKVYVDGGEEIELEGQNPGSGIWYKNDHYELRGKGDNVELTKDGKTVFKN